MGVRRGFHYKVAAARSTRQIIGTFGLSRDIPDKKRAEEKLAALARELREKNETLEQDLEMPRELQQAMLQHHDPRFPDHSSKGESTVCFYHFYRPSMSVSGDFFESKNTLIPV
jgi:serine phosphatase RsbU (regulator of sigma subunit)